MHTAFSCRTTFQQGSKLLGEEGMKRTYLPQIAAKRDLVLSLSVHWSVPTNQLKIYGISKEKGERGSPGDSIRLLVSSSTQSTFFFPKRSYEGAFYWVSAGASAARDSEELPFSAERTSSNGIRHVSAAPSPPSAWETGPTTPSSLSDLHPRPIG